MNDGFGVFLCGVLVGGILASAIQIAPVAVAEGLLTFETAVTLTLSALAVILTAVAVIVAIAGVFGFRLLQQENARLTRKTVADELEPDGKADRLIQKGLQRRLKEQDQNMVAGIEWGDEDDEYGER